MDKPIGALWSKTSGKGTAFFTGNVEIDGIKTDIVIFKNDKGDNEKRPDYKIYVSKPKPTEEERAIEEYTNETPF